MPIDLVLGHIPGAEGVQSGRQKVGKTSIDRATGPVAVYQVVVDSAVDKQRDREMNIRDPQTLIEKLKELPPERVAEVEDFVDFLRTREEEARDAAAARLGEAMAKLAELDLPPMSEEEVQAEIDAARRERRERLGAGRR